LEIARKNALTRYKKQNPDKEIDWKYVEQTA